MRTTRLPRYAVATSLLTMLALLTTSVPAGAVTRHPAATRLRIAVTPTTAKVGSVLVVSGTAIPRVSSLPVVVARYVGKKWVTLGHAKASKTGTYSLRLRAPKKAATWILRVTRKASATVKAAASPTTHVRVVTSSFAITARPNSAILPTGGTLLVTGTVGPKSSGSVSLQRLIGTAWVNVAKGALTSTTTYGVALPVSTGSYTFRVAKAFTKTVAAGLSKSFTLSVLTSPQVTTTALPKIVVGVPYIATLTATLGTPPYTWSLATGAFPAGLSLSTSGVISGRPLASGLSTAKVKVTDVHGFTGTLGIDFSVTPVVVRSWGFNASGELGNASTVNAHTPVFASTPNSIVTMSGGLNFALALRTDGSVWAWGDNGVGQLGIGSVVTPQTTPVQLTTLSGVVAIAAGFTSAYAVKSDGTVWAWGANGSGELGNGTVTASNVPVQVSGITNAVFVTAGDRFAVALLADGTVVSWGRGNEGELGNNSNTPQQETPVAVSGITTARSISAGIRDGYAVLADGTVQAWGFNEHGELGDGTTVARIVPVAVSGLTGVTAIAASGFEYALALHANGTVSGWGYDGDGELGNTSATDSHLPIALPLSGIAAIAAGRQTGYALTSTGTMVDWGYNVDGELGNGTTTSSGTPAPVPGLSGVVGIAAGESSGYAILAG
jgi:alpha-tubulin suppressor-like RCC1 family protein